MATNSAPPLQEHHKARFLYSADLPAMKSAISHRLQVTTLIRRSVPVGPWRIYIR